VSSDRIRVSGGILVCDSHPEALFNSASSFQYFFWSLQRARSNFHDENAWYPQVVHHCCVHVIDDDTRDLVLKVLTGVKCGGLFSSDPLKLKIRGACVFAVWRACGFWHRFL
jgi:hypothetical protein